MINRTLNFQICLLCCGLWCGGAALANNDPLESAAAAIVTAPDNSRGVAIAARTSEGLSDLVIAGEPAVERSVGTRELIASLTIFVLAVFVGFEIITKVPPTLHTPLMSGSNAISGITIVGALIVAGNRGAGLSAWSIWLGLIAVVLAAINVFGGFLVTHRMLAMFKKRKSNV